MIICGIDPGTAYVGYGIIATEGNNLCYIDAGCIALKSELSLADKLVIIYDELIRIFDYYKPHYVSVERAFYAKNVHTTLVLGHARGVVLLAARKSGVNVVEFTPREIKKAVVGNGNATKDQVAYMVNMILGGKCFKNMTLSADMYDALAASICAYNNIIALNLTKKSI